MCTHMREERERERAEELVNMYMCTWERGIEREWVGVRKKERVSECACTWEKGRERESRRVSECVFMRERDRERVSRVKKKEWPSMCVHEREG